MSINGCNLCSASAGESGDLRALALLLKWFVTLEFGLIGISLAALLAFVLSTGIFMGWSTAGSFWPLLKLAG